MPEAWLKKVAEDTYWFCEYNNNPIYMAKV